jgi:hypothetical protein
MAIDVCPLMDTVDDNGSCDPEADAEVVAGKPTEISMIFP